jgi:sulfite reductase (NADPH) flavoprotein alpha-component
MTISINTTPLSSTLTLSSPSSPPKKSLQNVFNNPGVQSSNIIEYIASRSSSTLYIYDLAKCIGFGTLTQSWSCIFDDIAAIVCLQTRPGAGLSLVGRLSQGTSRDAVTGTLLTVFTTPTGLSMMAESLIRLPPPSPSSRLVLQVPNAIAIGETLALSPSLAPLATFFSNMPQNIVVLLSATPQEAVDLATLSYQLIHSHVVHLFDHHSCCREIGHTITPPDFHPNPDFSISAAITKAGYASFDYAGDQKPHTVIVLLNGPLALFAKAVATQSQGIGVVVVRVLRPWQDIAFLQILPTTVQHVHVFDEVPNSSTQGCLYVDVFGTLLNSVVPGPRVHGHRIVPKQTQEYLSNPTSFTYFISSFAQNATILFSSPIAKKLLFFSVAGSPLSALPHIVEDTFIRNQVFSTRFLTDYDVCSSSDAITVDRMLFSQDSSDFVPVPVMFPLDLASTGESDFLGVFDHNLLTSHSILKFAKPGSEVLVVTPWSAVEFGTKVPADVLSLAVERNLHIYLIDAKDIAKTLIGDSGPSHDAIRTLIVHLAFLRLYLGTLATESLVFKTARFMFEDVIQGIELIKINARAWTGLVEVDISTNDSLLDAPAKSTLKEYEFNAITVEQWNDDSSSATAQLGTWHDAARHILFPSVFGSPVHTSTEQFAQDPNLRPEIPDRTFLVTCTVNRRLTPLEYDRNVFHLEFDSTGTGLTYSIGEALGVHGWNDEQEVLDFCAWYGVDPERLITIPIPGGDKMHTRTVLQALQQQIDLFGRPPKSFYSDLAAYATTHIDKLALEFIGSQEGSSTFKKLSEVDTVTFADVLALYPSARPRIEVLCEIVGDIKPRHYSIASAQAAVGDRVDLLVVTVDWMTPNGDRFRDEVL